MKPKKIFLILGALVAIGAGVAVVFLNRPHRNAAQESGIRVTAAALQQAYAADEAAANAQYLDKTLEVTGTVAGTEQNQDGRTVLYLDDAMTGVGCTLRDAGATAIEGGAVTVKGFCSGSTGMGVALRECVLVK